MTDLFPSEISYAADESFIGSITSDGTTLSVSSRDGFERNAVELIELTIRSVLPSNVCCEQAIRTFFVSQIEPEVISRLKSHFSGAKSAGLVDEGYLDIEEFSADALIRVFCKIPSDQFTILAKAGMRRLVPSRAASISLAYPDHVVGKFNDESLFSLAGSEDVLQCQGYLNARERALILMEIFDDPASVLTKLAQLERDLAFQLYERRFATKNDLLDIKDIVQIAGLAGPYILDERAKRMIESGKTTLPLVADMYISGRFFLLTADAVSAKIKVAKLRDQLTNPAALETSASQSNVLRPVEIEGTPTKMLLNLKLNWQKEQLQEWMEQTGMNSQPGARLLVKYYRQALEKGEDAYATTILEKLFSLHQQIGSAIKPQESE